MNEDSLSKIRKDAFEFADKINMFYFSTNPGSGINSALLEHLGEEKYKLFCQNFKKRKLEAHLPHSRTPYFKEEFVNSPYKTSDIFLDEDIRYLWPISFITQEAKKFL